MKRCSHCNNTFDESINFCPNDGKPLVQTANYQTSVGYAPTNKTPPIAQTGGLNLAAPIPQKGNERLYQAHNPTPKKSALSGFVIAVAILSFVGFCSSAYTQSVIPIIFFGLIIVAVFGGRYLMRRQK